MLQAVARSVWFARGLRPRSYFSFSMLQAERSLVRIPMSLDSFNSPNHSSRTMSLRLTHPLTEMGTMNLPGGGGVEVLPVRKADSLIAISADFLENVGSSTSHNHMASMACYKESFTFVCLFKIFSDTL
jgi:hypothetical protein